MAKVRIELNSAAVRALLKSPEIAQVCEEQAERMTRATGMDYVSDVHIGKSRVNAGAYSGNRNAPQTKDTGGEND